MPGRAKPPPRSFQDVLAAAIADIAENGFDSMERIERWTRELRMAAERSLISPASLEQQLAEALAAIYRRMVDQGGYARYQPGVPLFTIDRVKPELRSELDRRIRASANLIKLNRDEAIENTLRRFQGWSTSVPPGGVSAETRAQVRKDVRKSLASLPFEERRVIIDQGHKLTGAINEIIAKDGGAIACEWRSNWRQPGYDYRIEHKERDRQIYLVRDSWAHHAGLVKKGSAGYYDEVTAVGQEPFCRCYAIWKYALRDLPEAMLTAKGKAMLLATTGQEEVRSARFARADDAGKMGQRDAAYTPTWRNKITRCRRCSMFLQTSPGVEGNACTAVDGPISAVGHCRLFEIAEDTPAESPVPIPVDREHDVAWMFVLARDASRLYADRTLPRLVTIGDKTFDPAELGFEHEIGEYYYMLKLTRAFFELNARMPNEAERKEVYRVSHERGGIPRERAAAERRGIEWAGWEAWSRGELARLENRTILLPPPDAHVVPAPHDPAWPMAAVE